MCDSIKDSSNNSIPVDRISAGEQIQELILVQHLLKAM